MLKMWYHNGYIGMAFPPVCDLIWIINLPWVENVLSQWLHWYGLSSVCVFRWFLRVFWIDNFPSHWLHWYVFSPVCFIRWLLRQLCVKNILSHYLYWYGFSHPCVLRWVLRSLCVENIFITLATFIWVFTCVSPDALKYYWFLKILEHIGYINMAFLHCVS